VGRVPGGGGGCVWYCLSASWVPERQRLPPYFIPAPMALPEKYRNAKKASRPRMNRVPREDPSDAVTGTTLVLTLWRVMDV